MVAAGTGSTGLGMVIRFSNNLGTQEFIGRCITIYAKGPTGQVPAPPATKAAIGDHDENIDFAAVEATVGASTAEALRQVTLAVYTRAEGLARSRGLLLADTKFEFGRTSGKPDELVLADEVLTPDSSRWWPVESYEPGRAQPSFDKQFVRDWLTSPASGWDKNSGEQPPQLPDEIVDRTRAKYIEAYERLTGRSWK